MEVHVRYVGDDDPKKCTARRLAKVGLVELHSRDEDTPAGIVLDPHAEVALSPADADSTHLIALDASWESADAQSFSLAGQHRALPFLVAANPINFGQPFQLTTAEALAAGMWILGDESGARRLMEEFSWGEAFLEMNREPLERYRNCPDSRSVVDVQNEYLEASD